nr:MAG TPA: hypothetical protein [Crassvirales sp.]
MICNVVKTLRYIVYFNALAHLIVPDVTSHINRNIAHNPKTKPICSH